MHEYRIELLEPAWAELEAIANYHLTIVGRVSAKKITDQILTSLERLKKYPLSGAAVHEGRLKDLGYRYVASEYRGNSPKGCVPIHYFIYRVIEETVWVYHIVHGLRDYPRLFKI